MARPAMPPTRQIRVDLVFAEMLEARATSQQISVAELTRRMGKAWVKRQLSPKDRRLKT